MSKTDLIRNKMVLMGLSTEPNRHIPILVLREEEGQQRYLPIWISMFDASIIAMQKSPEVHMAKPVTIEIMVNLMRAFGITLLDIEIIAIRESLYCAQGTFICGEKEVVLPLRPSDGVLLSLLTSAPLYCYEKVFTALNSLVDTAGEMPLLRENEFGLEGSLPDRLAHLVSQASGETPLEEFINNEEYSDDEAPEEEMPNAPAAMLLGDEAVDPEMLKDLLKNLDKRYFGRHKM